MNDDTYPTVIFTGRSAKTHAAWSTDPQGALYQTWCGRHLRYYDHAPAAPGAAVTCKACIRNLSARWVDGNAMAGRTLRLGQEASR